MFNFKPANIFQDSTATISPDEVEDIAAMYDASQVTKIVSKAKEILSEKKDMNINKRLLNNFREPLFNKILKEAKYHYDIIKPIQYVDYLSGANSTKSVDCILMDKESDLIKYVAKQYVKDLKLDKEDKEFIFNSIVSILINYDRKYHETKTVKDDKGITYLIFEGTASKHPEDEDNKEIAREVSLYKAKRNRCYFMLKWLNKLNLVLKVRFVNPKFYGSMIYMLNNRIHKYTEIIKKY